MPQVSNPFLILVGIDYSTTSELALERALELAAAGTEVHVVHVTSVAEPIPPSDAAGGILPNLSAVVDQDAYEELKTHIAVSVGAFEKKQGGATRKPLRIVAHLRFNSAAQEIAQLASDLQADLVVVGMHGRSAVSRFFLGSVAENVTRLAPCPVLVFRPKGLPPEYPKIEPPCPRCVETRLASGGTQYWCEQHRERHGQRHVYYQTDRMSTAVNLPLVSHVV
jgi:nucleotide-binding universal stress UspA family protein